METTLHIDFEYHKRSNESIAQGYLTNSKNPDCFIKNVYPTHIKRGKGCELWDRNNNRFIDYICGLGTNLIGYADSRLCDIAENEMRSGMTFSLASLREVELAEMFKGIMPFIDRVKFLKTGSEAATAALKIARNYTGRKFILSEGYHGWHSEFTSLTPPASGCTEHQFIRPLENLDQITEIVAAVIVEPVQLDYSIERLKWLQKLREKCDKEGVVLIFDEIITGFRFKKWSVSNYFNIQPDIILLGKAIANGFPLSVVGGKKDLMDDKNYFVSSTHAGENVSMAVSQKVIELMHNKVCDIDTLWGQGEDFQQDFNNIWPDKIRIVGYPTRGRFEGDERVIWKFWQEACKSGMLFGPSWFYNFKHSEFQFLVIESCKEILNYIKNKNDFFLQGDSPCQPFTTKQRQ
jgi:glutamate-1-semialdehyde 2,1-aminomutase